MKRKIVICLLTTVLLTTVPFVEAQQAKKVPRIGVLVNGTRSSDSTLIEAFRQGLRELGYIEGQNITIEYRFGEGNVEPFPALTVELVRLNVDVIVVGGTPAALAAQRATQTIPVVFATVADPLTVKLAASLAHPGGNATGLSIISVDLTGKRLEILKETVPKASQVTVLWNPANPSNTLQLKEAEETARSLGVQLETQAARSPNDLERAVRGARGTGALLILDDPFFTTQRTRLANLAATSRLPTIYGIRQFVEAGGLMTYGPSFVDNWRRAATYVDKILKGAKPADLPVEQPMKFEFVINLKTAKQIGLTIPPNVLARADKVIK